MAADKTYSDKEFKKIIQKHIDRIDFVKVNLEDDSSILGFIVKASDDFLMIEETNDFSLAGTKIVPYERVSGIRHGLSDKVSKMIYSKEGLIKLNQKIIKNTSLKDFEELFNSIRKQNFHCIVESKKKEEELFSIGEILEVNEKSVIIKNYSPVGKIDKKPRKINFKHIEIINFNDNYFCSFQKIHIRIKIKNTNMKIAIIGAGNMGLSFSKSFLKYELIKPENLHLITRNQAKIQKISEEFPKSKISLFENLNAIDADLIIIAVKPQDFQKTAENIKFSFKENQMILSIMAGIKIEKIQHLLNHKLVVRAMPNSPTLLGMGITGYTSAQGISFNQLMNIERLLNSTGRSVYLENEELLDGVTALSGSGPAYFYYIVDAMIKAGTEMGIDENLSKLFVKQTMLGAYHLINNSDKSLEDLIKDVASKGGTTEAALKTFEENNFKEILQQGILNAEKRAKELNG